MDQYRYFYINEGFYDNCEELGWVVVIDGNYGPCGKDKSTLGTVKVHYVSTQSYSLMPGGKSI